MPKYSLGETGYGGKLTFDQNGDELTISEKLDVTGLLERNKILRGMPQRKKEGYLLASVDPVTYSNWEKEWRKGACNTITFPNFIIVKLQDPDNAKFKVTDMKI